MTVLSSAPAAESNRTWGAEPISALYLDSSATCPLKPGVIEAMAAVWSDAWGNPSSLHSQGIRAAEALERARLSVAASLGAVVEDVLFTSGATESVHLALLGMAARQTPGRLVISAVEHPAVNAAAALLEQQGWDIARWPVDGMGRVLLADMDRLLAPPTRLVSVIWGQSEVGTLQPIQTIGAACAREGIAFHTDATQVVGQGCPDWSRLPIDLLSASAHKFGGPKGIGLLLARTTTHDHLQPLQGGGGQEQGFRAGTQPVALAAGMATALKQTPSWTPNDHPEDTQASLPEIHACRDRLLDQLLKDPRLAITGDPRWRLPHHISLLAHTSQGHPMSGRALVRELSARDISVSSGSACASGKDSGSAVLAAMGFSAEDQRAGLRISLGTWIDEDDRNRIADAVSQSLGALEQSA